MRKTEAEQRSFDEGFENGQIHVLVALEAAFRDARENTRIRQNSWDPSGTGISEDCLNEVQEYLLGKDDNHAGHIQILLMDGFYDARDGTWVGEPQNEPEE